MDYPIIAHIKDGKLHYLGQSESAFNDLLRKMNGQTVNLHVESIDPKTQNQLGYYYAVCVPMIRCALIDAGYDVMGVPVNEDYTDHVIKHFCAKLDGKTITLKRNMNKEKASRFIDNVIRWAATTLNISIPEPEHGRIS